MYPKPTGLLLGLVLAFLATGTAMSWQERHALQAAADVAYSWPSTVEEWRARLDRIGRDLPEDYGVDGRVGIDHYARARNWVAIDALLPDTLAAIDRESEGAEDRAVARARVAASIWQSHRGEHTAQARQWMNDALTLCEWPGKAARSCASRVLLLRGQARKPDDAGRRADLEAAVDVARRLFYAREREEDAEKKRHLHRWMLGQALAALATQEQAEKRPARQVALLREALDVSRSGHDMTVFEYGMQLGKAQVDAGDPGGAAQTLQELMAYEWAGEQADAMRLALAVELAWNALEQSDGVRAQDALARVSPAHEDAEWLVAAYLAAKALDEAGQAEEWLDSLLAVATDEDGDITYIGWLDNDYPQAVIGLGNDSENRRLDRLQRAVLADYEQLASENPVRAEALRQLVVPPARSQCRR